MAILISKNSPRITDEFADEFDRISEFHRMVIEFDDGCRMDLNTREFITYNKK